MPLRYADLYPADGGQAERLHETATRSIVSVTGLVGTPPPRGQADDLPEADGVIEPQDMWVGARVATLNGEIWGASIAQSRTEFGAVDRALRSSLHNRVLLRWQLDDPDAIPMQGYVRLIGELTPTMTAGSPVLEYQAQLRCADPYWVAQTEQSVTVGAPSSTGGIPTPIPTPIPTSGGVGGSVANVANAGNADAWPLITVTGPINGPVVENMARGEALAFPNLTIGAGQRLVIDTNPVTESVTVDGSSVAGALRWDDAVFPRVTAASTEPIRFYGVAGGYGAGTNMTVAWRDTYTA